MKRSLLTGMLCILASVLFAQEKDTTYILQEVKVTATRKASTTVTEPLSVTVIDTKDITIHRGYGMDDVLSMVPGVLAQSRFGTTDIRLTIRGFGARGAGERSNSGTSRGIRVLLDGFPETEPDGRTAFDLVDPSSISRIEVVRSNASALWGNGAGGLVSLSSVPATDRPFVSLQSSAGSFGFRKDALHLGTNVGNAAFFLHLTNASSEGWRKHSQSSQTLLNTGIVAPVGERTTLGVFILGTSNMFHIPGPLSQAQYDADPSQAQSDTSFYKPTYVQRDERRFNRLGRLGVSLAHGFDENNSLTATAYINPKYLQRSERGTFRDFTRYHVGGSSVYRNSSVFSEGLRGVTSAGVDEAYQDGAILFYNLKNGGRDSILADNKREGANSLGIFAQEDLFFGDNIILTLGARYDNVTYISESFITPTGLSDRRSFTKVTPKAGIVYLFSPLHSIYASYGGGVEVPAGNETDPAQGQLNSRAINPLLDPIISSTLEVGTKQSIAIENAVVHSLVYDLAAYLVTTSNDIIPYQNGRFYLSAGETRRMGVELSADLRLAADLRYTAAVSVSNNVYTDYTVDSVYTKRPIALTLTGKTLSYQDNDIAGLPRLTMFHRLRWEPSFFAGFFLESSLRSVGSYFADDANILSVPASTILAGAAGYHGSILSSEHLWLNAVVSAANLLDAKYVASAYINPDYGRVSSTAKQAAYLEPGSPRSFVASLGLEYRF